MASESRGHQDTSGRHRNRHKGLEGRILLFSFDGVCSHIGAMTENRIVPSPCFFRFPAKKLVRRSREPTSQTRTAIDYVHFSVLHLDGGVHICI